MLSNARQNQSGDDTASSAATIGIFRVFIVIVRDGCGKICEHSV